MTTLPPTPDGDTPQPFSALQPFEIERGERLLYRLTEFGRILWEVGIDVGPGRMLDLVETLHYVDLTRQEDFYHTLKASLLSKHEQEAVFDQMFLYYWSIRDRQNKQEDENRSNPAQKNEKNFRLPPSERKRLAEHMNKPSEQHKDIQSEKRETERRRAANQEQEAAEKGDDDEDGKPQR